MTTENGTSEVDKKSSRLAGVTLWLGGSALLGSLALVLWNRRILRSLREAQETGEPSRPIADDDIY
jgi:hypothetical protein